MKHAINMVLDFLEEVFIKDDSTIPRIAIKEINRLGVLEFKKRYIKRI